MDWKNRKKPDWPSRPKSLSERGYRKLMVNLQGKETIGGVEYTLQVVSPEAYLDNHDRFGRGKNTKKYMDWLFRNVVVSPPSVTANGIDHFQDDPGGALELLEVVENFLGKPKQQGESKGTSTPKA